MITLTVVLVRLVISLSLLAARLAFMLGVIAGKIIVWLVIIFVSFLHGRRERMDKARLDAAYRDHISRRSTSEHGTVSAHRGLKN